MINLRVEKNEDVAGEFYDFSVIVDTGTTVAGVNPGLMNPEDLEFVLIDLKDQIDELLPLVQA